MVRLILGNLHNSFIGDLPPYTVLKISATALAVTMLVLILSVGMALMIVAMMMAFIPDCSS